MIINVGKYIFEEMISKELLDLCELQQFPVITMPWKYHLTDILQEYSRQIFLYKHEQEYLFHRILSRSKIYSEEDEARLLANHFSPQGTYCICVLTPKKEKHVRLSPLLLQKLSALAENHLNQLLEKICVLLLHDQVVLVFHECTVEDIRHQIKEILSLAQDAPPFFGGIGSMVSGVERITQSYEYTCAAMLYAVSQGASSLSFDETDEFQLFFACRDQAVLNQFTDTHAALPRVKWKRTPSITVAALPPQYD